VGALVYDGTGRILLVQRRHDPDRGRWSVPGGRVEPGESDAEALVREMHEETGLTVVPGDLVGSVRRGPFVICDYRCAVAEGRLRAGDDALDARWCDAAAMAALPLVEGLVETLTTWGALPGPGQACGTGRPACSPPRESP
jgi:ADP-ribose pyrophosphatase YjhB (NUDIX family)